MTSRVLRLSAGQKSGLIADSRYGLPDEICGILGGRGSRVEGIFPVLNTSSHPGDSFYMDPHGLFLALVALEDRGWDILAMYHSHPPGSRTDPSRHDLAAASYPGCLQVIIVPGAENEPDSMRAFDVTQDMVSEVSIVVE